MDEVVKLLEVIVAQLETNQESALVNKLNQNERDLTLQSIYSSIDSVRDAVLEVEYKLEQIDVKLENIDKSLNGKIGEKWNY